ncbi:10177_t:CDS:2, partial [Racocetra persica]
ISGAIIVQFFIQGLRPEYAMNIQAAKPNDLNYSIEEAPSEDNTNSNKNDQAIAHFTEQIAKLNINLTEKQPAIP